MNGEEAEARRSWRESAHAGKETMGPHKFYFDRHRHHYPFQRPASGFYPTQRRASSNIRAQGPRPFQDLLSLRGYHEFALSIVTRSG